MPAIGTTTFSDPSVFQADFRGATINLVFTGPGIFSARLTSVSLPHLELHSVQENLARIAYVSLPSKYGELYVCHAYRPVPDMGRHKNEIARFNVPRCRRKHASAHGWRRRVGHYIG